MKTEHEMMDILISSNRQLLETNEDLTSTHIKSITLIEKQTKDKHQLENICHKILQWLIDKRYPTKKERYWKKRLQKTLLTGEE